MKFIRIITLLYLIFIAQSYCNAQTKFVSEKDITDLYKHYILKKPFVAEDTAQNLAVGKASFAILPAIGYSLTTKLALSIAGNVAYKFPGANLSSVLINPTYTTRKQLILPIKANIWTKNNRFNIVSDIQFLKYPQSTYGLGALSTVAMEIPMDYNYFRISETINRKIKGNSYLGLGYKLDLRWKIKETFPQNTKPTDVYYLGFPTKSSTSGLTINYLYDNRKSSIFPTDGFYFNAILRHNNKFLGSNNNSNVLITDTRKYINFHTYKSQILAIWNYNWLSVSGELPYLDLPSNGWDMYNNSARGYIQGRFRGYNLIYGEAEYRFQITKNNFLSGVTFSNYQMISNAKNLKFSKIIPGGGLGLRIKINKLSQTNLGIDYGFGLEGSRGLFLNIGEVF